MTHDGKILEIVSDIQVTTGRIDEKVKAVADRVTENHLSIHQAHQRIDKVNTRVSRAEGIAWTIRAIILAGVGKLLFWK